MKQTQQQAQYRLGGPMWNCGVCQMYRKSAQSPFGSCTAVTGQITPYGVCDRWSAINNPYGNFMTDRTRFLLKQLYDQLRAENPAAAA